MTWDLKSEAPLVTPSSQSTTAPPVTHDSPSAPVCVSDFSQVFKLAPNLEECFLQPLRMLNASENDSTFSHNLTPHQHRYNHQSFRAATSLVPISLSAPAVPVFFGISVALDMISQCLTYTPMLTALHIHRWLRI